MHLFDGVHYFLAHSLPDQRALAIAHVLNNNGASQAHSIEDPSITHLITNSNRFQGWQEISAREDAGSLVVVTDKWVDKSMLLGKLQPPSCYSADPAMIFSGVIACASELPTSDLEVLSAGITALGGQWRTGLTKDVTHLFCIHPSSPKYTTALHFQSHTHVKIILPHWFDDAIRIGIAGLDTTPYEWPDPPLLKGEVGSGIAPTKEQETEMKKAALRKLDPEKRVMYRTADLLMSPDAPLPNANANHEDTSVATTATTPDPPNALANTNLALALIDVSPALKTRNVWQGRRVLLARNLELSGNRREAVETEIRRSGGEIVNYQYEDREEELVTVDKCDVFVARFRAGKAYVKAVRLSKTIGTLPWVFHVQSTGVLSPPMDQLLWYPIPKKSIEGFSGHEITVTNYTGESREYIKKLILAMGATFTPSMSGKNTVLIAAYISGTKTTKAASWSIPIVNHLWLEDCFIKWRNLTPALEKYILFPPGVDFSGMLGERGVGRGVEEEVGEEELEGLEKEDEIEEGGVEVRNEKAPVLTQNSAREVREVEETVAAATSSGVPLEAHTHTDTDMDLDTGAGGDKDGDAQTHTTPGVSKKHRKGGGISQSTGDDDDMLVDELVDEQEMEPAPRSSTIAVGTAPATKSPSKSPVKTPTASARVKTIAERVREKVGSGVGDSPAKTRIRPRVSGGRQLHIDEGEGEENKDKMDDDDRVVVSRRKSGRIDMVSRIRKRMQSSGSGSSSSDDAVVIVGDSDDGAAEHKSKRREKEKETPTRKEGNASGSGKLVRRLGERSDSWIADAVVMTPLKSAMKKKGVKAIRYAEEDEDEEDTERKGTGKESPVKPPSRKSVRKSLGRSGAGFIDDEAGDDGIQVGKRSSKRAVGSDSDEQREEEEEEEEEEESVVPKGMLRNFRGRAKAKARKNRLQLTSDEDIGEVDEAAAVVSESKSKSKSSIRETRAKGKRKATSEDEKEEEKEIKKKVERRKASKSRGTKGKLVVESPESEDEIAYSSPVPKSVKKKVAGRANAEVHSRRKGVTDEEEDQSSSPPPVKSKKSSATQVKKHRRGLPSSDEDEDDAEISPPVLQPKKPSQSQSTTTTAKPRGRQDPTIASLSTPQRTAAVVLPQTAPTKSSSTKGKEKVKDPPTTAAGIRRTESFRTAAGERAMGGGRSVITPSRSPAKRKVPLRRESTSATSTGTDAEEGEEEDDDAPPPAPASSGRTKRSAAARATQKLHEEIMPDVMNYQQEMRNAGKGRRGSSSGAEHIRGRKRHTTEDEEEERVEDVKRRRVSGGRKDLFSESENEVVEPVQAGKRRKGEDDTEHEMTVGTSKKTKKTIGKTTHTSMSPVKPSEVRVMTTQVALTDDVIKILNKLGAKITTRPADCTHLLTPHLVRTEKFLCAVAHGAFILNEKWATDSATMKRLLDEGEYLLVDKANERKFDFVLSEALARAKELQGKLFSKMVFYVTPKVPIDFKLLKNVVTACGGQLNTQPPTLRILNLNSDRYIISCPEDAPIWRPIARSHPVYNHELILTSALKQEIDWDDEKYRVPGSY